MAPEHDPRRRERRTIRSFAAPEADAHRTQQLIVAFAQQYGGRLGPRLDPVDGLENEHAKAKIAKSRQWQEDFQAALNAGDEAAASRLAGGTVRIADGMTGNRPDSR